MRYFKKPWFKRFAEKEGISDDDLKTLVAEMEAGTVHASLGGDVYKQRIARKGEGKSGGYRTLLFFRSGERVFSTTRMQNLTEQTSPRENWWR